MPLKSISCENFDALELEEMTPRAFESLPFIDPYGPSRDWEFTGKIFIPRWYGELDSVFFVAEYSGTVIIGDFGLYRVGPLHTRMVLRPGVSMEDVGRVVH